MWHENNHEGNINLLHGTRGLHTGGASSCHATVNGSKSTTNTTDADRSAILISLPEIIRICNEYITKTHCQTGTLFTLCSKVIVINFLLIGLEAEKGLGRIHQMLPKNKTTKFCCYSPATSAVPTGITEHISWFEDTSFGTCYGFHR